MDRILFSNEFLAIIERNGYFFFHETRCNGSIVALLPFRITVHENFEFLARLEVCPAHGQEAELCSITGGLEEDSTIEHTAQSELWEEAGYQVSIDDLINLGQVHPSKSSDTVAHLFAIDVTTKVQSTAPGDQSRFEQNSTVQWVDYNQGISIQDPLFVTALIRLSDRLHRKG